MILLLNGCAKNAGDSKTLPRLVVFISVDQFRFDYLNRFAKFFGKDGFNYLIREGASFVNCQYEHAETLTSTGHAVMMSGLHPKTHGVIANKWYDRGLNKIVKSVEDTNAPVLGMEQKYKDWGCSPIHMIADNLGDRLKLHNNQSKVFGVSNKPRSAIFMAGRRADAAYWMHESRGGFFTSGYYMKTMPSWVQSFNAERSYDRWAGKEWNLLIPEANYTPLDSAIMSHYDYPKGWSGTFPYIIGKHKDVVDSDYYRLLLESPYSSEVLLDFAKKLTIEEKLGTDDIPDILCISFSANDMIGHSFGPSSREVMDISIRTDRYLTELIQFMNATVGKENVLYVLTSDHGVASIPEDLNKQNVDAGRISPERIIKVADHAMVGKYGRLTREKSYVAQMINLDFYFNDRALEEKKIDKKDAETYISEVLNKAVPQIFQILKSSDLISGKYSQDKVSVLIRNSYNSKNSGDLMIVLKPNYIFDRNEVGAEHGSPFSYDRHVPLIMAGARWIKTGTFGKPCSPADIAPTLAKILGIEKTEGFDGTTLKEGIRIIN
jgi:predicted AlkP superfamily pyrophosphatase or phosphodiesterase